MTIEYRHARSHANYVGIYRARREGNAPPFRSTRSHPSLGYVCALERPLKHANCNPDYDSPRSGLPAQGPHWSWPQSQLQSRKWESVQDHHSECMECHDSQFRLTQLVDLRPHHPVRSNSQRWDLLTTRTTPSSLTRRAIFSRALYRCAIHYYQIIIRSKKKRKMLISCMELPCLIDKKKQMLTLTWRLYCRNRLPKKKGCLHGLDNQSKSFDEMYWLH
jgi:hypothetical protein